MKQKNEKFKNTMHKFVGVLDKLVCFYGTEKYFSPFKGQGFTVNITTIQIAILFTVTRVII